MTITVSGTAEEIAALALALQERRSAEIPLSIDGAALAKDILEASRDTSEDKQD